MSAGSEAVKGWRKRFRRRLRDSMGGKCVVCGYDKCDKALDIHHIDPTQKDFTFGDVRGNPRAIRSLVDELKKCALVCKRCHIEIHDGITAGPLVSSFNEEIFNAVAETPKKKPETDLCICGKEKLKIRKYCSVQCTAQSRSIDHFKTIDWDNRSIDDIAAEYGRGKSAIYRWWKRYKDWKAMQPPSNEPMRVRPAPAQPQ